jgi:hypothetical protein
MQSLTHDEQLRITRIIVHILDEWGVRPADQVRLLGLPASTRPRAMKRYHEDTPLPDDPAVWRRVHHIAGIAEALRTSYPLNPKMGGVWLNRTNYRFDNRTPLASMLEDGINGMEAVHVHLDCSYDWHVDSLRAAAGNADPA